MSRARRPDPTFTPLLARFALTGLAAMVVIGVIGFVILRRAATSNAIGQAKGLAQLAGRGIAEPLITPASCAATRWRWPGSTARSVSGF